MLTQDYIQTLVNLALEEDIGSGDITAGLVTAEAQAHARVISRESGVLCGVDFVNAVFASLDANLSITWHFQDGDKINANDELFAVVGNARAILTGERSALNFLQMLSGTATRCQHYADQVSDTGVKLLDTRKTIPAFRIAQKYAVTCGGCFNHRIGLFDAFLIKENHIEACGGISEAIAEARRQAPGKPVEIEVESQQELEAALNAGADRIMLDNFSPSQMREAVILAKGRAELEASGNITDETLRSYAETGVDFISIGALTKGIEPLDLSMRLDG